MTGTLEIKIVLHGEHRRLIACWIDGYTTSRLSDYAESRKFMETALNQLLDLARLCDQQQPRANDLVAPAPSRKEFSAMLQRLEKTLSPMEEISSDGDQSPTNQYGDIEVRLNEYGDYEPYHYPYEGESANE